jgi:hypothetical protein
VISAPAFCSLVFATIYVIDSAAKLIVKARSS